MKISVVASFYNIEPWVRPCIDSLLAQKGPFNLEIIAVDDCSTDGTLAALQEYKDDRLRVIRHERNRGLSAARNTAMAHITGDCFFIMDGDDHLPKGALAAMARRFSDDVDWVQGNYRRVDENGSELPIPQWRAATYSSHRSIVDNYFKLGSNWVHNRLVNKKYKDVLFPEGKNHEDIFWNLDVFPHLNKIIVIRNITYCYVRRTSSLCQQRADSPERGALWVEHMFDAVEKMYSMKLPLWDDLAASWTLSYLEQYVYDTPRLFPAAARRKIRERLRTLFPLKGNWQKLPAKMRLLHCLLESNLSNRSVRQCYQRSLQPPAQR